MTFSKQRSVIGVSYVQRRACKLQLCVGLREEGSQILRQVTDLGRLRQLLHERKGVERAQRLFAHVPQKRLQKRRRWHRVR